MQVDAFARSPSTSWTLPNAATLNRTASEHHTTRAVEGDGRCPAPPYILSGGRNREFSGCSFARGERGSSVLMKRSVPTTLEGVIHGARYSERSDVHAQRDCDPVLPRESRSVLLRFPAPHSSFGQLASRAISSSSSSSSTRACARSATAAAASASLRADSFASRSACCRSSRSRSASACAASGRLRIASRRFVERLRGFGVAPRLRSGQVGHECEPDGVGKARHRRLPNEPTGSELSSDLLVGAHRAQGRHDLAPEGVVRAFAEHRGRGVGCRVEGLAVGANRVAQPVGLVRSSRLRRVKRVARVEQASTRSGSRRAS